MRGMAELAIPLGKWTVGIAGVNTHQGILVAAETQFTFAGTPFQKFSLHPLVGHMASHAIACYKRLMDTEPA